MTRRLDRVIKQLKEYDADSSPHYIVETAIELLEEISRERTKYELRGHIINSNGRVIGGLRARVGEKNKKLKELEGRLRKEIAINEGYRQGYQRQKEQAAHLTQALIEAKHRIAELENRINQAIAS